MKSEVGLFKSQSWPFGPLLGSRDGRGRRRKDPENAAGSGVASTQKCCVRTEWRVCATAYRAPFISSKHWDKNGQIHEAYSGALGTFSTPTENDSLRCFPTKQVGMGCRILAQGGVFAHRPCARK